MKTRGRPRHPEVLTPRQQDVVALLRRGLTNEQIARELNISPDGVKYHVSDILRRLHVESRHEAALWQPEPARSRWALVVAPILAIKKLHLGAVGYAVATAIMGVTAVGIALLVWGVTRTSGGSSGGRNVAARLADGRLIAFTALARTVPGPDRIFPVWNINVYDAEAQRQQSSFEAGGLNEQPSQAVLAGGKIIVNITNRVVMYDIDGSNPRELRRAQPGGYIIGVGVSPDGTLLAVTEQTRDQAAAPPDPTTGVGRALPYAEMTAVSVLDIASGRELLSVPQTDPGFGGYRGQASLVVWRDDGKGFVVVGFTQSDAPGGLAAVMLDGSVRTERDADYASLSPDGRFLAAGKLEICDLSSAYEQHDLQIRELDTGRVVLSLQDDVINMLPQEWSHDGSELLYQTFTTSPRGEGSPCKVQDDASTRWYIVGTDGSAPRPVADAITARRAWYGAHLIEYQCNGTPVLDRYCSSPDGQNQPVGAYLNGVLIGSGKDFRLVDNPAQHAVNQ